MQVFISKVFWMLFFILPLLLPVFIFSQSNQLNDTNNSEIYRTECKTPASTPEQILATKELVENWLSQDRNRPDEQINILVAFHVIHASDGTGDISDLNLPTSGEWSIEDYEEGSDWFISSQEEQIIMEQVFTLQQLIDDGIGVEDLKNDFTMCKVGSKN